MSVARQLSFAGRLARPGFAGVTIAQWLSVYPIGGALAVGLNNLGADDLPKSLRLTAPALTHLPTGAGLALTIGAGGAVLLLILWMLATSVRRLHDIGVTGWLVVPVWVVVSLIPDAKWSNVLPSPGALALFSLFSLVPGTQGANRYGPASDLVSDAPTPPP